MNLISYEYASEKYASSFHEAVGAVAREKKFLASTEGFMLSSATSFVKRVVAENLSQYFALSGGKVIGWCDIIPGPYEGLKHVGTLGMGILAAYRNMSIGTKLMEMAISHAKSKNGIEKVELEVFRTNENAIRLYRKFGFETEGVRLNHRKLEGKYDDTLLMAKFI